MTIQFKTDSIYTLGIYKLECTYIEGVPEAHTIWFVCKPTQNVALIDCDYYKLNRKTNKLYKLSATFSSWDTIENTLSEYTPEDIWKERSTHKYSYDGSV